MPAKEKVPDAYILDTYRVEKTMKFVPGAVTYCKRRRMQFFQWKEQEFPTQDEADAFVRRHFAGLAMKECKNEGEMGRSRTS